MYLSKEQAVTKYPSPRRSNLVAILGCGSVVVLLAAPLAGADDTWTLPAGQAGDWSVATNWTAGEPTSSSVAYIINGGTATITKTGAVCSSLYLGDPNSSNVGNVQMSGGGLSTLSSEYVGNEGAGTFAQSGGDHSISGFLFLGYNAGSSGTYSLSGNGHLSVLNGDNEFLGYNGTGTFLQSGGSNSCGYLSIANSATGIGAYSLSGGYLAVSGAQNAENVGQSGMGSFTQSGGTNAIGQYLDLGNTTGASGTYSLSAGSLSVGYNENVGYSGTGSFTQSGGTHTIANYLFLGYNSGSSGTFELKGNGNLSVVANENVGYSGTGSFTQSGGDHSISGFLFLGYNAGSSGTYSLSGNGRLSVLNGDNEYLGYSGTGTFLQSGGSNSCGYLSIANSATGIGAYSLSGGYLAVSGAQNAENVGQSGTGTFTQSGGTNAIGQYLDLGNTTGASGTYSLSAGSLSVGYNENVGYSGTGSFTQSGGTHTIANFLYLGYESGSSGTFNLSGNGSLSVAVNENVGYSGTGSFTQSGGSHTIGGDLYLAATLGGSGTYSLSGNGALSLANSSYEYLGYAGTGTFTQSGGSNHCGILTIANSTSSSIGAYNLGGNGYLSANFEYLGWAGTGSFTQSAGTNAVGSLILAQSASSTGSYNLNGGLLSLSSLSRGAGSATFNFSGGTFQAASTLSTSVPIVLSTAGSNGVFDTEGNALTLSGPLSGAGGAEKIGTGTLTLMASNTYTGGTTISSGVLAAANPSALGTGAVNLVGGTLQIAGSPSYANPGSIGIKFASGEGAASGPNGIALPAASNGIHYGLAASGVAGVVPQANWNNVYNNSGSKTSLQDGSGAATSASVSWSAPSTYSVWVPGNYWMGTTNTAPTNPNDQLTNSYLSNYAPGTPWNGSYSGLALRGTPSVKVEVSGIPYASYKVYVYFDGAPWGGQAGWNDSSNSGGNDDGGVTVSQAGGSNTFYYQSLTGANAYASIMQGQGAGFGPAAPGGFYYQTTSRIDASNSPGANFAEFDNLSGGSLQVSQFVSKLNDGGLQDDTGIAAVQIVANPVLIADSPIALANAVNVTANSTIDVTGASAGGVGNLTIGNNTLYVTGGGSAANSNYSLTAGATTLTGNPTFDVANNGSGVGTLNLGALSDGGTARTITKAGNGLLILSTSAASLVQGTNVNITGGTLATNATGALGSFSQISLSPSADLILGANEQISSLNGLGGVALGSNSLTIGNSDNLSSTFSGSISGSGGSLVKAGAGTLILSGSNTYEGGTTVNAGTLVAASSFALPDGTSLTVGAGGTFIFDPTAATALAAGSPAATLSAVPEPGTLVMLAIGALTALAAWWCTKASFGSLLPLLKGDAHASAVR